MLVFFIVFLITIILSVILPADSENQWRTKLFWVFVPLCIFGALRVDFGNDYSGYELIFSEHHGTSFFSFDENAHAEIGFQFLCYILPSFRALLVLNTITLCLALGVFIYHNVPKKYLWLVIILLFLNAEKNIYGSLVGMRNGFAVSIFLLSVVFIQKRKLLPFAGMAMLAVSMHTSAILYVPLAYIIGRKSPITKKEIRLWMVLMVVFALLSNTILARFALPIVQNYFERYESYAETYLNKIQAAILLYVSSLVLGGVILSLFWKNRNTLTNSQASLYRLGLLYVFSNFWGAFTGRATYFYNMFLIVTVVSLLEQKKKNSYMEKGLAWLVVIISIYSFNLWYSSVAFNPAYRVYHSIFNY